MNDFLLNFLYGIIAGVSVSVPLGPAGLFCIQRTLSKGLKSGLLSGMGTAASDTVYATLAIFSLGFVMQFVETNSSLLFLVCGLALVLIGLTIFMTNPVKQLRQKKESNRWWGDFLTAFLMSISNPGCLFLILGVFTFLGREMDVSLGFVGIVAVLAGVFTGTCLWWLTLSSIINRFRKLFRLRQLALINQIAGMVIMVLGIISATEGLYALLRTIIP